MIYYKDTNGKPFVFEDNVTDEIITKVEVTHNTTLAKITQSDYEDIIAPTFEQLQNKKLSEMEVAYNNANELDIDYMSTTFQSDKKSQDLITGILVGGAVPSGFTWRDKLNVDVAMTFSEFQGLSQALVTRGQFNWVKYQGLKTKISLATTQAELDVISW